ncbi:MAG TPA: cyclopropane-fatty-acyl-phospholipid synthase family protein [Candidatus Krumholzibacteria bacterium]|nr:cyclopropane-fatty-acyl-phospholipid synthase family protein [Candidatus Krumholzibacteria bacterium]
MTSVTHSPGRPRTRAARPDERLARHLFFRVLRGMRHGRLEIVEDDERHAFGPDPEGSELHVEVRIHDPSFYPSMLLEGTVGVGRAFIEEHWTCDDLGGLIRLFVRNGATLNTWRSSWAWLTRPLQRAWLWARRNTMEGSRRNIHEHYDLGNDFFATFLDPTMMYSAAFYPSAESTLEEASVAKLHRICRKLDLNPDDRVLEIGTGWGGFAILAARDYGCHVTTITISEEQYAWVVRRVHDEGLEGRVDVRLCDYREIDGHYDKLVSIEMIEAVGADHLDTFARVCGERLKPDGRMLLQAIVIDDRVYDAAVRSVDYIKKFVFPGSFIPSLQVIQDAMKRRTDLRLLHVEDFGDHYARTLSDWHDRFEDAADRIRALGFDDAFLRRWRFYFKYCEGGFAERRIGVQQIVAGKPLDRRPVVYGRV